MTHDTIISETRGARAGWRASRAALLLALLAVPACARIGGPGMGACAPYLVGGAALGAGVGAVTGSGGKDSRRRAVVGAAAGAVGGYAICVRAWRQKAALEAQFAAIDAGSGGATLEPANRVVRSVAVVDNRKILLDLNVAFSTGQSEVPARAVAHLAALGSSLQQFPESDVVVDGHTDNVGDPARNRLLSQRRADAVAAFLVAQGVEAARIRSIGHGSDVPVADNATPEGRARNRRVEVTIQPTVQPAGQPAK